MVSAMILAGNACVASAQADPGKPNIILVMSDDQGFVDVGYNTNNDLGIQTPHLDQMAREGLLFNRFYATPNCSPTRASVLTGRHPFRTGVFNPGWAMNTGELTVARVLAEAGYSTAHFGKWHLGSVDADSPYNPHKRGFEYYLSNDQHFNLNPTLSLNGVKDRYDGEGSEVIVQGAINYIDQLKDSNKPFFILIWYGSPHGGFEAVPEDAALYADLTTKDVSEFGKIDLELLKGYFAEITAMDRSIGILRKALKDRNIDQNTLVLFNSDNGNGKFEQLDDLRGGKGSIWDGGLRVPAIAVWPEVIRQPVETDAYVATWDIMHTLMDIAGVKVTNHVMDGVSFYPLLQGKKMEREQPLCYWFYRRGVTDKILMEYKPGTPKRGESKHLDNPEVIPEKDPGWTTIIDGKWKYHHNPPSNEGSHELYNIRTDPGETNNVASEHPEVVRSLDEKLTAWRNSVKQSLRGEDYEVTPQIITVHK